jgi:hypothetical protein
MPVRVKKTRQKKSRASVLIPIRTEALGGGGMRRLSLKVGPLHLAAIVLAHFACMSLIVWLSL